MRKFGLGVVVCVAMAMPAAVWAQARQGGAATPAAPAAAGQQAAAPRYMPGDEHDFADSKNKAEKLEWFQDQGFGMFIHWGVDVQLGAVISHTLVGASPDYVNRFYTELPKTFNPSSFHPQDWAALAKLAGMKYVLLTNKHHSGFAMWNSKVDSFNVMNTPFHTDVTAEVFKAFRAQGISTGVYFSPDDFLWLKDNGKRIERGVTGVQPSANPGLLKYDEAELRELLTGYGKIDELFLDGEAKDLRAMAWKINPDILVTRGAIETPEQNIPGVPSETVFESCNTIGTAWQYQPQDDRYKSTLDLIRMLVQVRSEGGNLLLNVGPKTNGELPQEEEDRLRQMGQWMFTNGEAIYAVRPWVLTNEGNLWFTKKKDNSALYVVVDDGPWRLGMTKDYVLHSVKAGANATISVLGESGEVVEYRPTQNAKPTLSQQADGLHIHFTTAQRMQDNSTWPNPVVVKLTGVEPALQPPAVRTVNGAFANGTLTMSGELVKMGDAASLPVGFEYRPIVAGEDTNVRSAAWVSVDAQTLSAPGTFTAKATLPDGTYEVRAVVRHPLISLYGVTRRPYATSHARRAQLLVHLRPGRRRQSRLRQGPLPRCQVHQGTHRRQRRLDRPLHRPHRRRPRPLATQRRRPRPLNASPSLLFWLSSPKGICF